MTRLIKNIVIYFLFVTLVSNALDCFECSEDSVRSNPRVQQECLTQDAYLFGEFGERKDCNAFNGACAKTTWSKYFFLYISLFEKIRFLVDTLSII